MKFGSLSTTIVLGAMLALPLRAADWKTLAPKGAGFSVAMPGAPKATKTVEKDKDGDITSNYDWSLESESAYYTSGYQEHPAAAARLVNPDGILDESIKGITGGANKGKISSLKKLKSNGFSGREIKVVMPNGVLLQAKFFWVKRRLYMAMTAYPASDAAAAREAAKFLTSFKLLAKS